MNQRILELAKQAGIKANSEQAMSPQEQLFAELIVQECSNIAAANVVADRDALDIYQEIREHFGVES